MSILVKINYFRDIAINFTICNRRNHQLISRNISGIDVSGNVSDPSVSPAYFFLVPLAEERKS